eukprot:755542-Hanusia_phi.AAC.2
MKEGGGQTRGHVGCLSAHSIFDESDERRVLSEANFIGMPGVRELKDRNERKHLLLSSSSSTSPPPPPPPVPSLAPHLEHDHPSTPDVGGPTVGFSLQPFYG